MKAIRAILTLLWLLFGLTATAHAGGAPIAEPPCHMAQMAMSHTHMPAPHDGQTAMPCCSQPAIAALAEIPVPRTMRLQTVRLVASPPQVMAGQIPAFEPKPPQTA